MTVDDSFASWTLVKTLVNTLVDMVDVAVLTKIMALLAIISLIPLMFLATTEIRVSTVRYGLLHFFPPSTNDVILSSQQQSGKVFKITKKLPSNTNNKTSFTSSNLLKTFPSIVTLPLPLPPTSPSLVKWQDCGGNNSIIKYNSIHLDPFPLIWGTTTKVTASFTIKHNLTTDIESDFKIGPLPFTKNMPIPCLGSFGSCNENLCTVLSSAIFCDFMKNTTKTNDCSCPINPSTYQINNFHFQVPNFPPILSYFTSGDYRITWRWTKKSNPKIVLGCVRGVISFQ